MRFKLFVILGELMFKLSVNGCCTPKVKKRKKRKKKGSSVNFWCYFCFGGRKKKISEHEM